MGVANDDLISKFQTQFELNEEVLQKQNDRFFFFFLTKPGNPDAISSTVLSQMWSSVEQISVLKGETLVVEDWRNFK